MATIAPVSTTGSAQGSNATSITVDMPATRPDGDLYVMIVGKDSTVAIQEHASWTTIGLSPGVDDPGFYAAWRIGASEPASYTVTGDSEHWVAAVMRFAAADVNTADPIDVVATTFDSGNGSTIDCPTATPTVTGGLCIRAGAVDTDAMDAAMAGSGHTDIHDANSAGSSGANTVSIGISGMDADTTASTPVGTSVLNINGSDEWQACTFVIAPYVAPVYTQAKFRVYKKALTD